MRILLVGIALLAAAGASFADTPKVDSPSTETVLILGRVDCNEASPEHARDVADKASQQGAYQKAGECYLAAGQHALADQAFVKASSAQARGDTSRRLASNLSDMKAQARQMKQAFQHR